MKPFDTEPRSVKKLTATVAVAAALCGGISGYFAGRSELTGNAFWEHDRGGLSNWERVTRESAPSRFRQATNELWLVSGFCVVVASASFIFYRGIDDAR